MAVLWSRNPYSLILSKRLQLFFDVAFFTLCSSFCYTSLSERSEADKEEFIVQRFTTSRLLPQGLLSSAERAVACHCLACIFHFYADDTLLRNKYSALLNALAGFYFCFLRFEIKEDVVEISFVHCVSVTMFCVRMFKLIAVEDFHLLHIFFPLNAWINFLTINWFTVNKLLSYNLSMSINCLLFGVAH